MAAHTAPDSFTDTIYAISAALPATYDAAGYGATAMTYTTIGEVESFTMYGSKSAINKFAPVRGAVTKSKGARDYGEGDMVVADLPADAGQIIVAAAEASPNHYSMKITYTDGEVHYLDVIVAGWQMAQSKEGDFKKRTANIGICRKPVIVAAP
ncbi:MAG: hypothetical protein K2X55_00995 [Burkholderiaceae bacterium]|nr:hypothetical protein [Burkholderiaceae bacterium]